MPNKSELHRSGDDSNGALVYVEVTGTRSASNVVPALIEPGAGNF